MGWQDAPVVEEPKWMSAPEVGHQDMPDLPEETDIMTNRAEFGSSRLEKTGELAMDLGKDAVALGELGLTIATAGVGEIAGGFWNNTAMLLGRRPADAAESVSAISDAFTFEPKTERGKKALELVAEPLMAIEEGATDIAWAASGGNKYAATLIKTGLMAIPELLLPSKGTITSIKARHALRKKSKEIQKIAKDLGIQVNSEVMGSDIVTAAQRMTPAERAENAPAIRQALVDASDSAKARRDALYESSRQTKTWVETRSVKDLAADTRSHLIDRGFDLEEMPIVQKRLFDLENDRGAVRANLSEFEKVRKRVIANRSSSPSENAALDAIRRSMDEFLDNEFNKIAMGQGSAISGDTAGVQMWKRAREAHATWKKNFSEDKAIAQLIQNEASPEQYRQWLMGASAMNARKEAASTVRRMKDVLGNNHPAIEGIRLDFLYEVAEPLLKAQPNFGQFVRNYDAIIRKNPSLVRELGLKGDDLSELYHFAKVQSKIPPRKVQFAMTDLTQGLARFFVGHNIAKASMRVNIARNLGNMVLGVDRIGQKQILAELVGAKYGEVAIPKNGPLAAQFIAGAALTGIPDTQDE